MFKRILPSVRKRAARLLWAAGRGVVSRDGAFYLINATSRSHYDKHILQRGTQHEEPQQRAFLLKNLLERRCDTFIDIGANYGLYTLSVALQTSCGTIIAFEPGRRSFAQLLGNVVVNDLTERVTVHNLAVSNCNGLLPFTYGIGSDGDFTAKVGDGGSDADTVRAVRLDDALQLSGHRIALKIDIEGHELAALEGMKALLRNNDCFLQVESWPWNAQAFIEDICAEDYQPVHQIDSDYYFAPKRGSRSDSAAW